MLAAAIISAVIAVAGVIAAFTNPHRSPAGALVFAVMFAGCSVLYFAVWMMS